MNLLADDNFTDLSSEVPTKTENNQKFYLNWDELDEKNDMYSKLDLVTAKKDWLKILFSLEESESNPMSLCSASS